MPSFSPSFHQTIPGAPHERYMQRCLQLAALGAGQTAPNPMVGAVLVHGDRIIGEGYHEKYGGPHAEVRCINSVKEADQPLISDATLYVSLEPCAHHGKTPPCANLIIQQKIPRVVIGCRDPFPEVDGKGIEKLLSNGTALIYPLMESETIESNRRFFIFHQQKRPYIILKWAESANHRIAGGSGARVKISNEYSDRLVHKWRSEEAGILIGTRTALLDDPMLTTRFWPGRNPVRIVLDRKLRLPKTLKLFDESALTIMLNEEREDQAGRPIYKKIKADEPLIPAILSALYSQHILSILVEGGAELLQSFIDSGFWDEARIISNHQLDIPEGLNAPALSHAGFVKDETYATDTISYYRNKRKDSTKK